MALSGSYDFTLTAAQLIAASFRLINISSASTTQNTNALQALEILLKSLSVEGYNLVFPWAQEWKTQALVASTASYTLDQKIVNIEQAFIRDSSSIDHPVTLINSEQYLLLSDKTVESMPSQMWVKKDLAGYKVYLYPVPDDATDVLHMLVTNKLQDIDSTSNNIDINSSWFRALKYLLAAEIAPEEGILLAEIERLLLTGERLKEMAKDTLIGTDSVFISIG